MSLHGRSPSDTIWAGKEFDSLQHETLLRASQSPTEAHLDLAAEFIASSFRGWRITYAFIGGYALRLRGSQRRTNNVDIVIGTTVEAARRALLVSERVCFPCVYQNLRQIKLFVHSGICKWDGVAPPPASTVAVNLIVHGVFETPNLYRSCCEWIHTARNPYFNFSVLSVKHLFQTKLTAHFNLRASNTSHLSDIQWLIYTFEERLAAVGGLYDREHCEVLCNDLDAVDPTWGHWARMVLRVREPQ